MNRTERDISPPKLITALESFNLLPAIIFLPTRRRCDEAASELGRDLKQPLDTVKQKRRRDIFDRTATEFPEIIRHKHAKLIVNTGVASHHAGHIPAWKLLIEEMMSVGLLRALFATSTVAAGVDFPARTVVIQNADTRGNEGWRPLTASELQQMTGRAGRRGRDNVGFAILVPGQFQDTRRMAKLLSSPPDVLQSRFRATYTTILNLLDAFGSFDAIRDFAGKSFAFAGGRVSRRRFDEVWEKFEMRSEVLDSLGYIDRNAERVTADGRWLADLRIDRPLLMGESIRMGAIDELSVSLVAGMAASVTADPDRDFGSLHCSRAMDDVLDQIAKVASEIAEVEYREGLIPEEEINFSAAAAAERWADGMAWSDLVERTRAEEGDLVRLLARTGEALRQIAGLRSSHPRAARASAAASEIVLREPVR